MRRFFESKGSISRVTMESLALKNNMLDDSWMRVVDLYVPAAHDGEGLPLLVDLAGSCTWKEILGRDKSKQRDRLY